MLKHLHIQNYALIDELSIDFYPGLNIITGETGAGKSILLGALGLILGQRSDTSVLKDKHRSCVVEGLFDIEGYNLEPLFTANDLDYYPNTIIRRQISESGKSRAFVNEVPVTLNVLKDLVESIIDIHSQHHNLLLTSSTFQLSVLDAFAGTTDRVSLYRKSYSHYQQANQRLIELKTRAERSRTDLDYLQHQLAELDSAKLKPGEQEDLELINQQLTHADEIRSALSMALGALDNESASVVGLLRGAENALGRIASVYPPALGLKDRVESCRIDIRDIADEAERLLLNVNVDPEQMQRVSQRLDLLFRLQHKHRVSTLNDLIALQGQLTAEVGAMEGFDFEIAQLQKEVDSIAQGLKILGHEISTHRLVHAQGLQNNVTELLTQLGMPFAAITVALETSSNLLPDGLDRLSILFSANKQVPPQELSRVASGGELSRLMLCLKSVVAGTKGLPTIVFDEIDTGVSGEVAHKMGSIIDTMAQGKQIINITHLPQIASKGKHHFLVYKDNQGAASKTLIKRLNPTEREVEIAKMLSGENLSDAALQNAKHLLASQND